MFSGSIEVEHRMEMGQFFVSYYNFSINFPSSLLEGQSQTTSSLFFMQLSSEVDHLSFQ